MAQPTICPICEKAFKDVKKADAPAADVTPARRAPPAPTVPRKDDFAPPPPGRNGPDPFY